MITGATTSELELDTARVAAFALAFLSTAALWWLYFNSVATDRGAAARARRDRTRMARDAYTYLHVVMVAGVIVSAVGDELVIAHPTEELETRGGRRGRRRPGAVPARPRGLPAADDRHESAGGASAARWRASRSAQSARSPGPRRRRTGARGARRRDRRRAARRDATPAARRAVAARARRGHGARELTLSEAAASGQAGLRSAVEDGVHEYTSRTQGLASSASARSARSPSAARPWPTPRARTPPRSRARRRPPRTRRPGAGRPAAARPARTSGATASATALTGDTASKVKATALAKVPGGTVERVATDADHGSTLRGARPQGRRHRARGPRQQGLPGHRGQHDAPLTRPRHPTRPGSPTARSGSQSVCSAFSVSSQETLT